MTEQVVSCIADEPMHSQFFSTRLETGTFCRFYVMSHDPQSSHYSLSLECFAVSHEF